MKGRVLAFTTGFSNDPEGIKKLVGISAAAGSIAVGFLNFAQMRWYLSWPIADAITSYYVWPLAAMGLAFLGSAFWKSSISSWLQVAVVFVFALMSAESSRRGELTSVLYIIMAVMLLLEYRFRRGVAIATAIAGIAAYIVSLGVGYGQFVGSSDIRTLETIVAVVAISVIYGGVLLQHWFRQKNEAAFLESQVQKRTAELEDLLEERSQALAERSVMLQEIHHRVKNNLQVVASLLRLELNKSSDPDLRASMDVSINRIHAMALVHETLYESDDLHRVSLEEFAKRVVSDLTQSLESDIIVAVPADQKTLVDPDFAIPFGLVLTELVTNAVKHAYPPGCGGEVRVGIAGNHTIELKVEDDGVGIPIDVLDSGEMDLGLTIVRSLVQQLNGTINLDQGQGTRWVLTFSRSH